MRNPFRKLIATAALTSLSIVGIIAGFAGNVSAQSSQISLGDAPYGSGH